MAASRAGRRVLPILPNIIWNGEYPSALGVFRSACMPLSKSSPITPSHFIRRYFVCFTADSANPFELGLCGDDTSWMMSISLA